MTAEANPEPRPGPPGVGPDASPAQVRAALIPEEAAEFEREWREVLARAAETLELAEVLQTLESWRLVAQLTTRGWAGRAPGDVPARGRPADQPGNPRRRVGGGHQGQARPAAATRRLSVYEVTTDERSRAQVEALPPPALAPFAEARAALELAPWNGKPYHRRSPNSPMRTLLFGPHSEGKIVYSPD